MNKDRAYVELSDTIDTILSDELTSWSWWDGLEDVELAEFIINGLRDGSITVTYDIHFADDVEAPVESDESHG